MSLCYKDMTFCSSDCTQTSCHRYFGDIQRVGAKAWWGDAEEKLGYGPPIAFSDFSSSCPDYTNDKSESDDHDF